MCVCSRPVSEGYCQFSLVYVLVTFGEQTEELRLEVGLQQTVVLDFMQDEKIILSRTEDGNTITQANTKNKSSQIYQNKY